MRIDHTDGFDLHWPSPSKAARHRMFAFMGLFVGLLLIYSNSFTCEFHLDDFGNIIGNVNIQGEGFGWQDLQQSFHGRDFSQGRVNRPLAFLSFALNYRLHGWRPLGYHVVNFILHYAAAVVLYLLLVTCLRLPAMGDRYRETATGIALLAAFWWAIHPIHVTAVTYIVQRMAVMAGLFYLLAMLFFATARTTVHRWRAVVFGGLCLVSGLMAFFSKENAVTLPITLVLMEILLIRGWRPQLRTRGVAWLLAGVAVTLIGVLWTIYGSSILAGYHGRPFTLSERLLTQPRVWFFYIGLLLYPSPARMTLLYDFDLSRTLLSPWSTLPAMTILFGAAAAAVWTSRRWPMVAFSILFFLLNHLTEGSIIPLEIVFEHRNYLPAAFFFVPVAIGVIWFLDYFSYKPVIQFFGAATVVIVLIANGHTTYDRNRVFQTELTLWEDNVQKSENLHRPHHNLSKVYMVAGRYPEALLALNRVLRARAGARRHQKYMSHYNLGLYYILTNDLGQARAHLQRSLSYEPGNSGAYNQIARIHLFEDRLPEALEMTREAIRRNPHIADFRHTLGLIALRLGNPDRAIQEALASRGMIGDRGNSDFIIGEALRQKGDLRQAQWHFERYTARYPDHLSSRLALIEIYFLTDQKHILSRAVGELMGQLGGRTLRDVLDDYDTKYNSMDRSRIDLIARAVQQTLRSKATYPKETKRSGKGSPSGQG